MMEQERKRACVAYEHAHTYTNIRHKDMIYMCKHMHRYQTYQTMPHPAIHGRGPHYEGSKGLGAHWNSNWWARSHLEGPNHVWILRVKKIKKFWRSKTKHFCEACFRNGMLTGHLTSEFQYVLTIFKWMLQKYCACHEKVEPRHTKSCSHAKWSLQSNTSVTWKLQPFHGFCVGGFKHRHRKARNPCPCHAKRIVSEPLQIPHACQRFCNPHKLLRLPRILKRIEIPAPATRKALGTHFEPQKTSRDPGALTILTSKSLSRAGVVQILVTSTSKSAPRLSVFNDFDFQIVLARRRGANFGGFNFQKCSEAVSFNDFGFQIVLARRCGANFGVFNFQKCSEALSF